MKSKRLTIFCVALIALVGTPRAWQEVSKLLAAVQHKAQVKLWSTVLQPKNRESADAELIATAQTFATSPAEFESDCPLERSKSQGNQVSSSSQSGRRADSASTQPKARAQRPSTIAPASHAGLIAKSFKAQRENSSTERLRHYKNIPESQPTAVAGSNPASLSVYSTTALPRPAGSKSDTFRFAMMPAISPVASVLAEKENIVQFKMLKKALEENKLMRQKGRLPVSRGAAPLPAS